MTSRKKKILGALLIIVAISATAGGLVYAYWDHLHEDQYIEELRTGDALRKVLAAQKLGEIRSEKAIPALIEVVERPVIDRTPVHEATEQLFRSMFKVSSAMSEAQAEVSGVDEEEMRDGSADFESVHDGMAEIMGDPRAQLRGFAVDSLSLIGRNRDDVTDAIVSALEDPSPWVRMFAAQALGRLRGDPEKVVPALIELLEDPTSHVRRHAVMALGKFGSEAAAALPILEKMLEDPPRGGLYNVKRSLEKIRGSGDAETP